MPTKDPEESTWETDGGAVPKSDPPPVAYPCILCKGPSGPEDVRVDLSSGTSGDLHYSVCRACRAKRQAP